MHTSMSKRAMQILDAACIVVAELTKHKCHGGFFTSSSLSTIQHLLSLSASV